MTAVSIADADGLAHVVQKDLAVADLAGARGFAQLGHHLVGPVGRNHHFELYFGQ